jgi:hypothetical protein
MQSDISGAVLKRMPRRKASTGEFEKELFLIKEDDSRSSKNNSGANCEKQDGTPSDSEEDRQE